MEEVVLARLGKRGRKARRHEPARQILGRFQQLARYGLQAGLECRRQVDRGVSAPEPETIPILGEMAVRVCWFHVTVLTGFAERRNHVTPYIGYDSNPERWR